MCTMLLAVVCLVSFAFAQDFLAPSVKWAQRKNRLLLKIVENNISKESVDMTKNRLVVTFEADVKSGRGQYRLDLVFHDDIDPAASSFAVTMWNLKLTLKKATSAPYWPRLLAKTARKLPNVVVDWPNWLDEEDDPTPLQKDDL